MEYNYLYKGDFADCELSFEFHFPETALYFGKYLSRTSKHSVNSIRVKKDDFLEAITKWNMPYDGNLEYCLSMYRASDQLMKFNRCIFHGAAFLLKNKVYLISAESGIGKTTQIKNWMSLHSEEIILINGDKPILQLTDEHSIIVHPSPWKGKEDWGNDDCFGELGGIILLKRDTENSITRASAIRDGARLFSLFFSTYEKSENVKLISTIETEMWKKIPIWNLKNTGDVKSAEIAYKALIGEQ